MNFLQRLIVRSGRLPDQLTADLSGEAAVVLDYGLRATITYRNYRTAHQFTSWRKQGTTGAVAVTATHLVVWAGGRKHLDAPLGNLPGAGIEATGEQPSRICFAYDAATIDPAHSGRIEIRLRTTEAARILQLLVRPGPV